MSLYRNDALVVSKMEFWKQFLATAGVMAAILAPFVLLRWLIYKRDLRELERERQQWLKEMDERQQEARRRREAVDEIRQENPADRPVAVDKGKRHEGTDQ